jgi:hypothetical protein
MSEDIIHTGGLHEIRDSGSAPPLTEKEAKEIELAYERAKLRKPKELLEIKVHEDKERQKVKKQNKTLLFIITLFIVVFIIYNMLV